MQLLVTVAGFTHVIFFQVLVNNYYYEILFENVLKGSYLDSFLKAVVPLLYV